MTKKEIQLLLDTCFVAKRITETMLKLPKGIKPRHIHVIECIHSLGSVGEQVKVRDVSNRLGITTPSITKLINELNEKGVIEKYFIESDKRVTLLKLTEVGQLYYNKYVENYHTEWAKKLTDVTAYEVSTTIDVIRRLSYSMPKKV